MTIPNSTFRVFPQKLGGTDPSQFVGNEGDIFWDPNTGELKVSDGSTPGGVAVTGGGGSGGVSASFVTTKVGLATAGLASEDYVNQQIGAPITQSLIPDTDNAYDLGSSTKQWRELYVTSNTMYVGGVPVGVSDDGRLTVNREPLAKLSELNEDRIEVLETDVATLKSSSSSSSSSSSDAVLKTDADFKLTDNKNASFQFVEGNNIYLRFNTFNSGEKVQILQDLWVSDGIHCADYIMLDGDNKELKFANRGGKYVGLKAPLGLSDNVVFTLPGLDGSDGQVLTTDGNGNFGWTTPSTGGGSTDDLEQEIVDLKTKTTHFESLVGIASVRIEELQDAMITMQAVYNGQIQSLTTQLATLPKTVHASWNASTGSSFDWSTDEISSTGVSGVTRVKKGVYRISFSQDFSSTNYTVTTGVGSNDYGGTGASPRGVSVLLESRTVSSVDVICERTDDAVNEDNDYMSVIIMGT